jgi:putative endonuclease
VTIPPTTKALGDLAEARALDHLSAAGLVLVRRNYRVARGPRARGGEVDLVMRDRDGTLVFVEVRVRRDARFGGAAASIGAAKRQRLVFAASHFLRRLASPGSTSSRWTATASNGCARPSTRADRGRMKRASKAVSYHR